MTAVHIRPVCEVDRKKLQDIEEECFIQESCSKNIAFVHLRFRRSAAPQDLPLLSQPLLLQEEHAIADRMDDSKKSSTKNQRRGPLFVPTFVDVASVMVDGKEHVAGYCAWSCEPAGTSSETCIHIMNLAVAEQFRILK